MSLNDWLGKRRLLTPDRVGVVDDTTGRLYRYDELDARACRIARYLQQACKVQPGDRVACLSANRMEYLDLCFACGKIGAILVPLNIRLPASAILELLADCACRVLVHEAAFAQVVKNARTEGVVQQWWSVEPARQGADLPSVAQVLNEDDPAAVTVDLYQADETDTAMILYTSGTTGRAKGAMISYRQIHWNALNTIIGLQLTQDDTAYLNMPLYHTGGWHVLFTPLILLGGRVVLQQRFDAERCNELLGPEGITILFGLPTTLRMMAEARNFSAADFTKVRFAIFGGESCPLHIIETYAQRGVAMRQGYGLTEAGPNCFSLPAADAVRKNGSIGFPNFNVDVRLMKEDGTAAQTGEVGELQMKGPHVFSGYWNNPSATDEVLHDGWLSTGDLMTRDEEGYYYVVGRKKEMYVSGGENVYPAEVERVLQKHESVAQSAVIGVADSKWGETGCAFIELVVGRHFDEDALRSWCRQHLAGFQCPTRFAVLEKLPIGPSGKVDKLILKSQAQELNKQ